MRNKKSNNVQLQFILLLLACGFTSTLSTSCNKKKADSKKKNSVTVKKKIKPRKKVPVKQAPLPKPTWKPIGWYEVDYLMRGKEIGDRLFGRYPEWKFISPEYFLDLAKRKKAIIAWAKQSKPQITVIGFIHRDEGTNPSPNELKEISDVQRTVIQTVKDIAPKVAVIGLEEFGRSEHLTWDSLIDAILWHNVAFYKTNPQRQQVVEYLESGTYFIANMLKAVPDGTFMYAEEGPIMFERKVRRLMVNSTGERREALWNVISVTNVIRSQISLIRVLEYLKKHKKKHGVLVLGDDHRKDIALVAESYGIQFTGIPAPNKQ